MERHYRKTEGRTNVVTGLKAWKGHSVRFLSLLYLNTLFQLNKVLTICPESFHNRPDTKCDRLVAKNDKLLTDFNRKDIICTLAGDRPDVSLHGNQQLPIKKV